MQMSQKWFSILELAGRFDVVPATVAGWIEDGELEAVNTARKSSVRKRWRISSEAVARFERRRANNASEDNSATARKAVPRPTKNFFAASGVAR